MKTNIALVLYLALFLLIPNAYSQFNSKPGYIVKETDTLYGKGRISRDQQTCIFRLYDSKKTKKYSPEAIDAFRIVDGRYYVAHQVVESNGKMKWYFLELLVDGEIDLYALNKSVRFFMNKENEKFIELKDNKEEVTTINGSNYMVKDKRYVGQIKLYMEEAPGLFPEIDKIDNLHQRDLVKLSKDYHKTVCNEYECIDYTKNVPKVLYKLELQSGVNHHNAVYTPQFGLLVHIGSPLRNERLYIKTGLLYSARNDARQMWTNEDYPKGNIVYNIKIPLSLEYVFGKKSFKPMLAVGVPTGIYPIISVQGGFIYSISPNFELNFSGSADGILSLVAGLHPDIYKNNFGHSIQVGLVYVFR